MIFQSIPSPGQGVWHLGPLPVRAYALAIICGILVAWAVLTRRYRAKGGPTELLPDMTVVMVIAGIVGGRLYHVITDYDLYFGEGRDPVSALYVWKGGLGIWGAVTLGGLGAYLMCRHYGLRAGPFGDALAPGLFLAQAIGRFGNYFNQELYGKPTDLPWALRIDDAHRLQGYPPGTTFHPTFLYEALWCLAGALALLWLERRFRLAGGQLFAAYVMIYTAGRAWIECLRIDAAHHIFGLRLNVWTSIAVFLAALAVFVVLRRRMPTHPEMGDVWTGEEARERHERRTAAAAERPQAGSEREEASQGEPDPAAADGPDGGSASCEAFGEEDPTEPEGAGSSGSSGAGGRPRRPGDESEGVRSKDSQ